MQVDLKAICEFLSTPRFNRKWTVVELNDRIGGGELLQTVTDIIKALDDNFDDHNMDIERRLVEYLEMLRYPAAVRDS